MYGQILYVDLKEVINRTKKISIGRTRKDEIMNRTKKMQIVRKRKGSSNSQIFKHILYCLASGLHVHMLKKLGNGISEFKIKFTNKKSRNWTEDDISLFKDLDSLSSKVREEQKYEEMCKVRFKANMSKLCKGGFLEWIEDEPLSKAVKWKSYRILKPPLNVEKKARSRKKKSTSTVSINLLSDKEENAGDTHYRSNFENKSCTEILAHTTNEYVERNFYSACESNLKDQNYMEQITQPSEPEENRDFNVDEVFQHADLNLLNATPTQVDFEQSLSNSYENLMINDPLLSSATEIGCVGQYKGHTENGFNVTENWLTQFQEFS